MPSRTIPFMSYTAGILVVAYLMLVVVTVSMAAWQTNLAVEMHETEQDIARLETRYFDMVTTLDHTDPATVGLVKPGKVTYVTKAAAPAVTLR